MRRSKFPSIVEDSERKTYVLDRRNDEINIPAKEIIVTTIDHYDENKNYIGKTREYWNLVSKERKNDSLVLVYKKVKEEHKRF